MLDFARRFEIIRKEQSQKLSLMEVDFSDEDAIAASLRCPAVIIPFNPILTPLLSATQASLGLDS